MEVNGVTHRRAAVNGIEIHYVEAGSGPPVFLLHGFPETWYAWRKQIPLLATNYTVIAPDLRGYGDTDKPQDGYDKRTMARDIYELMLFLGYTKIALAGHDRGARVATRFAKDYPESVDRLVVMDNIPTRIIYNSMNARIAYGHWFFIFNAVQDLPETLIAGREEAWLRFIFHRWCYNPGALDDGTIDVYVNAYRQPGAVRGSMDDYRAVRIDVAQDETDADRPIGCPVLALWGEDFELVGKMWDVCGIWHGMAKDVQCVMLPECGHLPHEERPDAVNLALIDFLKGWNGAEADRSLITARAGQA